MMPDQDGLCPICFIAMPFRKRQVTKGRTGAPSEIDFDALWDKAYRPAIIDAGYTPVRADFDSGTVIVKDMIERLAYADLVLADVSLPNGNVYYELGLRHAARETGCIAFAADWSNQLFDIEQFRAARYALSDGDVPNDQAEAVRKIVVEAITKYKLSRSPWYEFVERPAGEGWAKDDRGVFRQEAEKLAAFQADLQAIRREPSTTTREQLVLAEIDKLDGNPALNLPEVAVEMVVQIRDVLEDWQKVVNFIDGLSDEIRKLPFIEEQKLLAMGKSGDTAKAVAHLESLVSLRGETPERLGLIGGRYKQLWRNARAARLESGDDVPSRAERENLNSAIDYYDRGMQLDLNEYYCACNLPMLLMARGRSRDAAKAQIVDNIVVAACERALDRDEDDGWTRPTLLGAAFRAFEIDKAEDLADRVESEGASLWKVETTLDDLKDILAQNTDHPDHDAFESVLKRLQNL